MSGWAGFGGGAGSGCGAVWCGETLLGSDMVSGGGAGWDGDDVSSGANDLGGGGGGGGCGPFMDHMVTLVVQAWVWSVTQGDLKKNVAPSFQVK